MNIIKGKKEHKERVLEILDEFRTTCTKIMKPGTKFISTTAKDLGGPVYDEVIESPTSVIFIAQDNDKFIGIVTAYVIPRIRKGVYYCEIIDMFVKDEYQGKGISQKLLEAVETWAKEKNIHTINLNSGVELKRAHAFYEKMGFRNYAKGYKKILT